MLFRIREQKGRPAFLLPVFLCLLSFGQGIDKMLKNIRMDGVPFWLHFPYFL